MLRNADVAAVEVDDPLGLDPGDKIVTLRSLRNDPLARLHSRRQIDEAQFQGGRAFQNDWEKPNAGRRRSIHQGNMSMADSSANQSQKVSARPCYASTVSNVNSAPMAPPWCTKSWFSE